MNNNPYQSSNISELGTTEQPKHRSFQLTGSSDASKQPFVVGTISDAIRFSLFQQIFFLLLTSMMLDGGVLFRCAASATFAVWCIAALELARRDTTRREPTILLIKWGYLPVFLIAYNAWSILSRLF